MNGTVRDDNYMVKILFSMNGLVSFGTDRQLMYFMSTRFLKYNINGVSVPQFQLDYIYNKTNPSYKNWFSFVVKYIICGGKIKSWNYRSERIA